MSRYLEVILEGEISQVDMKRLDRTINVYVEKGKSYVTITNLPRDDLEEIIQKIGNFGFYRSSHDYDLGKMPKHKNALEETIIAYELEPFGVDIPANPEADFEEFAPEFKGCAWLKPNKILQVLDKPQGHMVGVGVEIIVDDKLGDLLSSFNPKIIFGEVLWKNKKIPWRRVIELPSLSILDKNLAFNPSVPCQTCGAELFPLKSTLIAAKGVRLEGYQFIRNADSQMHKGKEPIFILSVEAAQKLISKFRSGYVLNAIFAYDSPTADYMRTIKNILDKYIPISKERR